MTTVLIFAKFPVIAYIAVNVVYLIFALIFHYRVIIQAIIDKCNCNCISETICIKMFKEEFSFAGDRLGHSNIHFFYPKEMQVGKYKLKVIGKNGELKQLRAVMSLRRLQEFSAFHKYEIEYFNVTYLKKSKVVVSFDLVEDVDKIVSKRKKEEIKKAIYNINMYI